MAKKVKRIIIRRPKPTSIITVNDDPKKKEKKDK